MATVAIPNTFVTGTTILASEMNANFNAITAQVNGNLDANNLANSAVTENKIANLAVTEGKLAASAVATAKIANLAVTEAKLAASAVTNAKVAAAAAIDATKVADGSVSNIEFQYLNGVTSAIQTQLDAKEDTIALTANRAVASDGSGALVASVVTATELGYLDGVTSAIQTQLDAKLDATAKAADSDKLDNLDSTAFLRSNTSDSYTSGTLSFSSGTVLNLASAALILPVV